MLKTSSFVCLISAALAASSGMRDVSAQPVAPAGQGRTAAAILAEIKALADPPYSPARAGTDPSYRDAYVATRTASLAKRAPLILELSKLAPDTPELGELLPERWKGLAQAHQAAAVVSEITDFINNHPTSAFKANAAMIRATTTLVMIARDAASLQAALAAFEEASPQDKGFPTLLKLAFDTASEAQEKQTYLVRLEKEFPGDRSATFAQGEVKAVAAIGKPFDLAFTDVVTGKKISMADYKGKIVVVDFWATWCGPCIAEMPKMKAFYNQYKGQGVEVIGVSLDHKGDENIQKIRNFVAKNDIPWPQYYQGDGWDSAFSGGWGVAAIPCMFVIDGAGKLVTTAGRNRLDTLIPALIKQRDAAALQGARPAADNHPHVE